MRTSKSAAHPQLQPSRQPMITCKNGRMLTMLQKPQRCGRTSLQSNTIVSLSRAR